MGESAVAERDGYMLPTEEKLNEIGPGCFVQFKDLSSLYCWLEVISLDNTGFNCIARPALTPSASNQDISEGDRIFVNRDQITALGCERYCYC